MKNKDLIEKFKLLKSIKADDGFKFDLRKRMLEKANSNFVTKFGEERLYNKQGASNLQIILNNLLLILRKKNMFIPILIIMGLLGSGAGVTYASQSSLPGETLYPVKLFTEDARVILKVNPEAKANLEMSFALKRIDEIKEVFEEKGIDAKGLDIARQKLEENLANAAQIIESEKAKGKDITKFAEELNDSFKAKKELLKQAFEEQKDNLKLKEQDLKVKIREAKEVGDVEKIEKLTKELLAVKSEKELLEDKKDQQEEALEDEEERLEKEMEGKIEAQKMIEEAKKERQELVGKAQKEGIDLPQDVFEKFNRLLAQAEELFERENYQGAKQLAKQAEKSLDEADEAIDDLEKIKEEKEEQLEEMEDKQREIEEKVKEASEEELKLKKENRETEQELKDNEEKEKQTPEEQER